MKEKMKKIVKGMAVTAVAVSVILGSVMATPVKAEAKGKAFINKKVSSVTPTIKSAKRSKGKTTVTVSVPASKAKKFGKVEKIDFQFGLIKNGKKFEVVNWSWAKPAKKRGKNQYTFTINNMTNGFMELETNKNIYIKVKFGEKTNWSKPVKVRGKAFYKVKYWLRCKSCGKTWYSRTSMYKLYKKFENHDVSRYQKFLEHSSQATSFEELCKIAEEYPFCGGGYENGCTTSYSN